MSANTVGLSMQRGEQIRGETPLSKIDLSRSPRSCSPFDDVASRVLRVIHTFDIADLKDLKQ